MNAFRLLRLVATCLSGACVAVATNARAMGALVSSPPGAAEVVEAKVAVSSEQSRTARWASLHVKGTATAFAWIVPVTPSAFVDWASDAWMESLAAATTPHVVPPEVLPPCNILGGDDVSGGFSHVPTTAPDAVSTVADRAGLDALLASWGLAVPSELAPGLDGAAAQGQSFVALFYAGGKGDVVTRTLRVVDASVESLPLSLLRGANEGTSVTAYILSPSNVALGDVPLFTLDPRTVVWQSDGTSTYATASQALLAANPGGWLVETSGHSPIFQATAVPGGDVVSALSDSYFFRAGAYGDATEDVSSCTATVDALAANADPIAPACAPGSLAQVGVMTPCTETVGPGALPPASFVCGGVASDLALGLSGLSPAQATITRARTFLASNAPGSDLAIQSAPASMPVGPVVVASSYAETCMPLQGVGAGGPGPTGSTPAAEDDDGGGGNNLGSGAAAVAGGVVSGLANSDGCDGDSSSDSCGGDGTNSSDENTTDSGCSSSSSGSSDSGSDSCSNGNSSTNCSTISHSDSHRRRSPMSRFVLVVAAIAALTRRSRRPR